MFSIAARNIVGQGPFWPSCAPSDSNCNAQGSPACFDPVTTKPVKIQNFGVLGPNRPNAFPMGTSQLRVQWGVNGNIPDPYYDYTDRKVNGGRNVIRVEVQRTEAGLLNQVMRCTVSPASLLAHARGANVTRKVSSFSHGKIFCPHGEFFLFRAENLFFFPRRICLFPAQF